MEPLNDLPESVREIAEVIGRESALRLIKLLPTAFDGKAEGYVNGRHKPIMYVPKTMSLANKWARFYLHELGWEKAIRLIRAFGGEILYPANCKHFESRQRDHAIRECLMAGENKELIAETFGVNVRHVLKLMREIKPGTKPPEETNAEGIHHVRCN